MRRFQFVWWGFRRWVWGFRRLRLSETDLAHIYKWCLFLGPVEVRRWTEAVLKRRAAKGSD